MDSVHAADMAEDKKRMILNILEQGGARTALQMLEE